ncbi:MAG: tetraacyldisaccharide 4'-kinase [Nitrospirae bacterium]|nr:tetraacyldisaccharide 4'-kinase [Candidatus Manganitrophaceae bacterium]
MARKLKSSRRVALWRWIWNRGRGLSEVVLFPFTLLAALYGLLCRLRILLYEKGFLERRRVDCRVVSVGNLTVGGTGKTPFTIFLAEEWQRRGAAVGVVSRGYGGTYKGPLRLVSDGQEILEDPSAVGDEPYLIAQRLKGVPVIVSPDRFEGCRWLLNRFKLDVLLLDDAFQHIRLHRDLNLLLVDATNPFGNGALLPRGTLREPLSEVRRADVVIFTRSSDQSDASEWIGELERLGRPCVRTMFQPTAWMNVRTGATLPPEALAGEPVLGFCGIGNPDSFATLLKQLQVDLREQINFRDHHRYQADDLGRIQKKAQERGVTRVVTTEKDAVKIKGLLSQETEKLEIWMVRVEVVFWDHQEKWGPLLFEGGRC